MTNCETILCITSTFTILNEEINNVVNLCLQHTLACANSFRAHVLSLPVNYNGILLNVKLISNFQYTYINYF